MADATFTKSFDPAPSGGAAGRGSLRVEGNRATVTFIRKVELATGEVLNDSVEKAWTRAQLAALNGTNGFNATACASAMDSIVAELNKLI